MTAQLVDSSRPSVGSSPTVSSVLHHEAVVGQDRLPRQRADQERHEERQDHQTEQQVLVAARLERDDVGQRIGEHQRHHGGGERVGKRPQDLVLVCAERVRVVAEVPRERQRGQVDRAAHGRQRRPEQRPERHHEEDSRGTRAPAGSSGTERSCSAADCCWLHLPSWSAAGDRGVGVLNSWVCSSVSGPRSSACPASPAAG